MDSISLAVGLFIGFMAGMPFAWYQINRSINMHHHILPGQWFEIPRAGPFCVSTVNDPVVTGKYLGGMAANIPLKELQFNARPCAAPLLPMPGSIWEVPHMGRVTVLGTEHEQVSYSTNPRCEKYNASKMSVAQFFNMAEPVLQLEAKS